MAYHRICIPDIGHRETDEKFKRMGREVMTNKEIMQIALQQSAYDCNCNPEDFLSDKNIVTFSKKHPKARRYLPLPLECDLVSYGNNIVAQVSERTKEAVTEYIDKYALEHCFETPNIHALDEKLHPFGLKTCFMAEYFLPEMNVLKELPCEYELRVFEPSHMDGLYVDTWSNAVTMDNREVDKLAVGAYDGDTLIGLSACSADCEKMYQIGVDVLPVYRQKGVAAAITSRLALEIIALGKVPFYCAAWCNIKSVRNAIKSGFRPAWVEVTARDITFVDKMNVQF